MNAHTIKSKYNFILHLDLLIPIPSFIIQHLIHLEVCWRCLRVVKFCLRACIHCHLIAAQDVPICGCTSLLKLRNGHGRVRR